MKYKLLILLTSICLLLSACSGDSISSSESPSSAITTSSTCDAVNSYFSDDSFSASTESTLDTVGQPEIAYLNTYNLKPKYTDFPLKAPDYRAVSSMENNDDNIYKCFSENYINTIYTKRITEPLKYVLYAKDYYSSDSTDYNLIPDDSVILTSDSPLITNSNTKVKYVNYLLDDSEIPEENWIDYFSKQLCGYDSPVMIKEACRKAGIKSTIKYNNHGCTINAANLQHIAENVLNRNFHADKPNQKWLTDVTEFKWFERKDNEWITRKVYLSAILDLYDRRIESYVIGDSNNNPLVYDTFDLAVKANPDAHPLFHSDRGFQYTNRTFYTKLTEVGMTQSMSRVGKCIDNGPMEGFWGILKRERYYGKRFTSRENLVLMIEDYIDYYNNRRLQRNLGVLTPFEKHEQYYLVA